LAEEDWNDEATIGGGKTHSRSQDFVWGALFSSKKLTTFS